MKEFSLLLFFVLSFGLLGNAVADIDSGLVAHYKFDGNANDSSGNGNHGVIDGVVGTEDRNNTDNSAMFFNGTSKVTIENTQILPQGNEFTINAWVKFDLLSADHTLFDKREISGSAKDNVLTIQVNDGVGNGVESILHFTTIDTSQVGTSITSRLICSSHKPYALQRFCNF